MQEYQILIVAYLQVICASAVPLFSTSLASHRNIGSHKHKVTAPGPPLSLSLSQFQIFTTMARKEYLKPSDDRNFQVRQWRYQEIRTENTIVVLSGDQKHQIQPRYYQILHVKYNHGAIRRSETLNISVALSDPIC